MFKSEYFSTQKYKQLHFKTIERSWKFCGVLCKHTLLSLQSLKMMDLNSHLQVELGEAHTI